MRDAVLPSTLVVVLLLLARPAGVTPQGLNTLRSAASSGACSEFRQALVTRFDVSRPARVLIATVPDPHASGLAYGFDLTVDAIQRALAQQGYTLGGFWLPWRAEADAGTDCTERPGFISASPSGTSDPSPLLVLLVGETATTGVNVVQLRCALRLVGRSTAPGESGTACEPPSDAQLSWLGVLGPTFSGAAPSLWTELIRNGPVTVPIISGSATAKSLELGGTFQRTVLSDEVVLEAMLRYVAYHEGVQDDRVREDDIALLVESNTAYGAALKQVASASGATDGLGIRLQIPFPLGVHQLREDEASASPPSSSLGEIGLPLQQDRGVGASAVPQFSRSTESYDERRLETTLQSLARRRIRYIGILATNDLDKLFLARRARAFCPDATLFTLESSLLFTHPDEARVATGMLVASTYPLIPLNQEWTPWLPANVEVLQTFGTGTAEGIFNAALLLLPGDKHLADLAFPFSATHPPPVWVSVVGNGAMWPVRVFATHPPAPDAGATSDATQLWVTSSGRNPEPPAAGLERGAEAAPVRHPLTGSTEPWGAKAIFLLATGWVLLRTFSFWWVAGTVVTVKETRVPAVLLPFGDLPLWIAIQEARPEFKVLPLTGKEPHLSRAKTGKADPIYDAAATARARVVRAWLICLFLTVLLGYLGVAFLAIVPIHAFGSLSSRAHTALAALLGSTLALAGLNVVGVAWLRQPRFVGWAFLGATVVAGVFGFLSVLVFAHPGALTTSTVNRLLWYERGIAFSSGVTSVVPLSALWLGLYLFVRGHLQSLVNAPVALHAPASGKDREMSSPRTLLLVLRKKLHRRANAPVAHPGPANDDDTKNNPLVEVFTGTLPAPGASTDARDVLARDLHQGSWPRWRLKDALGPLAAATVPIAVLLELHRPTLDGRSTHALLLGGVSLVLCALAWSLHRVLSGTDVLLRLLRFVAVEPGFERLTAFFRTLPPKQYGRFQVLHPDVRLLARFSRTFGRPPTHDTAALRAWTKQLDDDLRTYDRWPAWGSRTFESIRVAALQLASWRWSDRPRDDIDHPSSSELDLLGTYVVLIVSWALTSIRNFLLLAGILSACLWVAFVSYPQSPHHLLLLAAWSAMAVCFVIGLVTFVRFERNDVLSKMSGTTEGKVTFDFAFLKSNWALLAGPVLALVVLEFPQFGRWLSEWAEPLLRTIK